MMINKTTSSVDKNLKGLDTTSLEPTNQNSIKVSKVFKGMIKLGGHKLCLQSNIHSLPDHYDILRSFNDTIKV